MLISATDGSIPEGRYDLAIVGAGAAGITLALRLAGTALRVCLIESGGFDFDSRTQALYEGELAGRDYGDLDSVRLRYFGGTTNHWGGWCRPLGSEHFDRRPWLSLPGWPIARKELEPYFTAAHRLVELPDADYSIEHWIERGVIERSEVWQGLDESFRTGLFQFSPPTRFGEVYRDAIVRAPNIDLYLDCSVTKINLSEYANHVSSLDIASFYRERFKIEANIVALATGAIEAPRLLLASSDVATAGIGNQHDMVGRCFMEHPHLVVGQFAPAAGVPLSLYDVRSNYGQRAVTGGLEVGQKLREELQILGCRFELQRLYAGEASPGTEALKSIVYALRNGEYPAELPHLAYEVVTHFDDVSLAVMNYLSARRGGISSYLVNCSSEQEPNPASRVQLAGERDAFGVPRVSLDWRLSDLDFRTVKEASHRLAAALGAAGLGRMRIDLGDSWPEDVPWGWHQMGTTRMSESPRHGVVDRDCRVHGVANLYVLGSSVFPCSGAGVPTLSIVALALRFADHMQSRV